MKFPRACLLALLLGTAAVAQEEIANESAGNYPMRAKISPWPARPGKCHLTVDLDNPKEGPSALATLKVRVQLDMPGTPKMKSIMAEIPQTKMGHYEGDVVVNMPGRWRVQFMVATPTGEYRVISIIQVGKASPDAASAARSVGVVDDACGPDGLTDSSVRVTWYPDPPQVGDNRLFIQVPKEGNFEKIMVGADMAGMPMAIPPQEATKKSDGRYEAELNLPMSGVWQVRLDLDGRVPPPTLLNVNPTERRPLSQPLLWLTLAAAVPLAIGFALRKQPMAPLFTALTLAVSTFSAGAVIERLWPVEASMDMSAPMPEMTAPTPVLQAVVQRLPLAIYKQYPARVEAVKETVLAGQGPVWELIDEGVSVKAGQKLARVGSTWVRAPMAGVVTRRLASLGQVLEANSPVLAVADVTRVRVRGSVPVTEVFNVRRGQPVDILEANSVLQAKITGVSATTQGDDYWIEATVVNIGRPIPRNSHLGGKLPIPKPGDDGGRPGRLALGAKVSMRCRVEETDPVLVVPKTAVVESEGQRYVMVVSSVAGQQLAHRRTVYTGLANDSHIEIASGLEEGETVVAVAEEFLPEGSPVTAASWGVGSYRDLMMPSDGYHNP